MSSATNVELMRLDQPFRHGGDRGAWCQHRRYSARREGKVEQPLGVRDIIRGRDEGRDMHFGYGDKVRPEAELHPVALAARAAVMTSLERVQAVSLERRQRPVLALRV
ncbi:MAG: hypothetical protein ACK56I_04865, partial [bacterium]